jgi:hypothetical protein
MFTTSHLIHLEVFFSQLTWYDRQTSHALTLRIECECCEKGIKLCCEYMISGEIALKNRNGRDLPAYAIQKLFKVMVSDIVFEPCG